MTPFTRTELLLGSDAMQRLQRLRIIIFGVGGVGSWCAESLVRSGVAHLTLVDSDVVCDTNLNRQLMATTLTLGQPKVEALRERLLTINPQATITALQTVYNDATAAAFPLGDYDVVVDAIDSLKDKALLILEACRTDTLLVSSMGAALKLDPSRIRVAEFRKVQGDPLARALRHRFKRMGEFPTRPFQCVYSDEPPVTGASREAEDGEMPEDFHKPQVNGTIAHVTAIFGLTLAGIIISHLKDSSFESQ